MKIEDIYPYFISEVPSCPDETARMAVEMAFRELCVRAKVWADWLDPITMVDGVATYDLEALEANALTESPMQVWVGDLQLTPKSPDEINLLIPDWQTQTSNEPVYFNMPILRQTVTVYPTPMGATKPLRIKGVFMPKRTITSIPDNVALFHLDTIAMGAKAKLMMQAKQTWSDKVMGDYWTKKFEIAVESASIDKSKGDVESSTQVRPRAFGG